MERLPLLRLIVRDGGGEVRRSGPPSVVGCRPRGRRHGRVRRLRDVRERRRRIRHGRLVDGEVADAVVRERTPHRHRQHVDALRVLRHRERRDPDDAREEGRDRGVDGHVQLARIPARDRLRVLDRGDRHAGRVAVLGGGRARLRVGLRRVTRQVHRAGERRGVGRPLGLQRADPVERDVHDDGTERREQDDRQRKQDGDLSPRLAPPGAGGRCSVNADLSAVLVRRVQVHDGLVGDRERCATPFPPKNRMIPLRGVTYR